MTTAVNTRSCHPMLGSLANEVSTTTQLNPPTFCPPVSPWGSLPSPVGCGFGGTGVGLGPGCGAVDGATVGVTVGAAVWLLAVGAVVRRAVGAAEGADVGTAPAAVGASVAWSCRRCREVTGSGWECGGGRGVIDFVRRSVGLICCC